MKQNLSQVQSLQWKMNQSLLQSIHLLQYTGMELIEYIEEISKENPLIEEINFDHDLASYKSVSASLPAIGEINQKELTMYDQLKQQLYTVNLTDEIKPIILFGIDSLNENGYLDISLELWAEKCNTTEMKVQEALTLIQTLEPSGIGARTLQECIHLQLKQMQFYQPFMEELLMMHLDWIAEENDEAICEHFGVAIEVVDEIFRQVKACHPKPGQLLSASAPEFIVPEAHIYNENGNLKISFYKWNTPIIEITEEYKDLSSFKGDAAVYLKEKYKQIDWLKQAVSYRKQTLERVIQSIVKRQYMFFEHGSFMLQPLTLKEIAYELGMHVSTISRTITNKYVQTKHGVISLKFFMQSGVPQRDGKQTASFVIKQLMKELIEYEDKQKPLSDEMIKKQLYNEFGITIARRTVMKYREQLNIPASIKRKGTGG
ncbi:RNA polymerase factor sigma-54 [Virgibacillus oceani]|uniref:RNA polymerase sigma-54 factor n=1 Tax=Virgibacillus oceani TaxID=1479511 RepID=A0A917H438_9BACI|nr:RNA polymerase factor sigma-54 [Virgibacillus oceani]GGG66972.1 RNA polymerase sigma-54 factor [Virgibacillus oceani]